MNVPFNPAHFKYDAVNKWISLSDAVVAQLAGTQSSTTSTGSGTTTTGVSVTGITTFNGDQLVYVDSTSGYWKAQVATDWGSGGSTGRFNRRLNTGQDGYIEWQYLGAVSQMSLIGYDTLATQNNYSTATNNKASAYVGESGTLNWGDNGSYTDGSYVVPVGTWIRIRHAGDSFYLEVSADRTYTDLPQPIKHTYTFKTTKTMYFGAVIHASTTRRIYRLTASPTTVQY